MAEKPIASTEGLDAKHKAARSKIEAYVYKVMSILDPAGDNTKRWKAFFGSLDDKGFEKFMKNLADKKVAMNLVMPNMKKNIRVQDLLEAAKEVNYKTSHRLWMPDRTRPGRKYLTNEKYLVLTLPIRRAQQEIDKKLSVPERDNKIDALTGQVVSTDKASSISAIEIQNLHVRGLDQTLTELVRVRGGDVSAYGDFSRQLEENGEAKLSSLDPRTRARSATIGRVLLEGMMIENNI